jgi:hypothetical protein
VLVPIATWNPARCVWETPQIAACGHALPYAVTWPRSGSMRNGQLFPHPMPVPATAARGFSSSPGRELLPTPRSQNGEGHGRNTKIYPRPDGQPQNLENALARIPLLRTPTAQLAINGGSQHPDKRRAGGHQPTLADQVEHELPLLPTPVAHDDGKRPDAHLAAKARMPGGPRSQITSLQVLAQAGFQQPGDALLPTPRASRGASGTETMYALGGERTDDGRPQGEVLLPTPMAADGERESTTFTRGNPTLKGALLPTPDATHGRKTSRTALLLPGAVEELLPTPNATDGKGSGAAAGRSRDGRPRPESDADLPEAISLLPTPQAADGGGGHLSRSGDRGGEKLLPGVAKELLPSAVTEANFGRYALAVRRWENALGREAPSPVERGRTGWRLSPRFSEWMMGLPDGWVTDVPGLSRNAQLRIIGKGVVPQQAVLALTILFASIRQSLREEQRER